jgi:long-chain acyl-CoA synthetase
MTSLATLLDTAAELYPDRTAIVFGDLRLTYQEVDQAANRVANLLVSRGIRPGDKVALSCANLPAFTTTYYGILKAGGVVVPLNILLKGREVAYHLADAEARAYFAFQGSAELPIGEAARAGFDDVETCTELFLIPTDTEELLAQQPVTFETVDRDDDDTAVILYTSGTTGQPKGAELRHRNLRDNASVTADTLDVSPERPETFLCVIPLFHALAQTAIQNLAISRGATVVLQPRFEPRAAIEAMLTHRVTCMTGVPTMYWAMLQALDETIDVETLAAHLRVAVAGGAALPVEIHRQFQERFGITMLEGYGLSETSPVATLSVLGEAPRVGSIGKPVRGIEMKLIDPDGGWSEIADDPEAIGEIAIKGHNVMKGYYRRPEATSEALRDGWFRTGDLGRKDADGWYYIVDRTKDLIIRGGYNVYPRELEEVLMQHPAVSLVAVIGVPHESHGEEVKAVVVKHKGFDDVREQDLVEWGKQQFAAYKYPRIVEFLDELPTTPTGKILKRALS